MLRMSVESPKRIRRVVVVCGTLKEWGSGIGTGGLGIERRLQGIGVSMYILRLRCKKRSLVLTRVSLQICSPGSIEGKAATRTAGQDIVWMAERWRHRRRETKLEKRNEQQQIQKYSHDP